MNKPVILLAFANETPYSRSYLRNLRVELNQLKRILGKAEDLKLCEVVILTNLTLEDLFDAFQNKRFRNRIAIFHFAGHANSYNLLLENAKGNTQLAKSGGLVHFIASQKGLQLVFLNGCYSALQAQELIDSGIPAVIGTVQAISDQVASNLASQFYKGLAEGIGIDYAWNAAVFKEQSYLGTEGFSQYYIQNQEQDIRSFGRKTTRDQFPWKLYYCPGKESIKMWNLPDAVDDPYFGLPELSMLYDLPDVPYRFLSRYQKKHQKIFFGRGSEIRALFMKLTSPHSSPLVLLFGQSGVGKSSFLDAGLIPRLNADHEVCYIRRNKEIGLLGQLTQKLDGSTSKEGIQIIDFKNSGQDLDKDIEQLEEALKGLAPNSKQQLQYFISSLRQKKDEITNETLNHTSNIRNRWREIEEGSSKKSLIVILDQVEEVFTQASTNLPNELGDLFLQLSLIFNNPENRPKGKILLSYRKEFDAELTAEAQKYSIPKEKIYLDRLNKINIIEVIRGITSTEALRNKYNLKIEEGLPTLIANNILMDKDSPLTPILQIILTKLWQSQIENPQPVFTIKAYRKLFDKGILLSDFFNQQIKAIELWEKEIGRNIEGSGLVLDILETHTTAYGTSETLTVEQLRSLYEHHNDILSQLIAKFQDLHLLTKPKEGQTRLAHDTLAPIIKKETKDSSRPGQVARRILEGKMIDYENIPEETVIEESNLKLVERGETGMRLWIEKEKELISKSRGQRSKNRLLRIAAVVSLVSLFVLGGLYGLQKKTLKINKLVTDRLNQANFARSQGNIVHALVFVQDALMVKPNDRGALELQHDIYSYHEFYQNKLKFKGEIQHLASTAKNDEILLVQGKDVYKCNTKGDTLNTYSHKAVISAMAHHAARDITVTGDENGLVSIWKPGKIKPVILQETHTNRVIAIAIAEWADKIVIADRDGQILVWSVDGRLLNQLPKQESEILSLDITADGTHTLVGLANGSALFIKIQGMKQILLEAHIDKVLDVAFSPTDPSLAATASRDGQIKLWKLPSTVLAIFTDHDARVSDIDFSTDGRFLLSASDDLSIKLWDIDRQKAVKTYQAHQQFINKVSFSADGQYFISGDVDSTIIIWKKDSKVIQSFDSFSNSISGAAFTTYGKALFTTSSRLNPSKAHPRLDNTTVYRWNVQTGQILDSLTGHSQTINDLVLSADEQLLATAANDTTAIIWHLDGSRGTTELKGEHDGPVKAIAYSKHQQLFVTGSTDHTAIIWTPDGKPLKTLRGHTGHLISVEFHPHLPLIYTAAYDGLIIIWSIDGKELQRFSAHTNRILDIEISPNGKFLLSTGWDNIAKLWAVKKTNLELLTSFTINQGNTTGAKTMNCAAFSPNSQFFALGSEGGIARLYNVAGQRLQSFEDGGRKGIYTLRFTPDNKYIFVGYSDGSGRIYENLSAKK